MPVLQHGIIYRMLNQFKQCKFARLYSQFRRFPSFSAQCQLIVDRDFNSIVRFYSESGISKHDLEDKDKAYTNLFKSTLSPGKTNEEVIEVYNNIQGTVYEQYMKLLSFNAPNEMVKTVSVLLQDHKDAKILDVGAGSGLGGVALQAAGFCNLDAVEPSSDMVQLAKSKNVYKTISSHLLGSEPLPIEDDTYDMVVLTGVMGQGHLPKEATDELIRLVKPGGHIVNVFREPALHVPWYGDGLEPYFENLEKQGKWKLVEKRLFPNFLHDVEGVVYTHRIQ